MDAAEAFTSATSTSRLSRDWVHCAPSEAWLKWMPPTRVSRRLRTCPRAASSWGWLATSPQPDHMSDSRLWMPVSPGSRKACSTSSKVSFSTVSRALLACSVWPRPSRKASRIRVTSSALTPPPMPLLVEKNAGTTLPPMACRSTRWRE